MDADELLNLLEKFGVEFYAGVPDSLLKGLCGSLCRERQNRTHIAAPNEGSAVALAAGTFLATGKVPCVYMQNSGIGNAVNPITSLTSKDVYSIPMVYIIGWRGEPGTKDEPQHAMQGRLTMDELDLLQIEYTVIDENTSAGEIDSWLIDHRAIIESGGSIGLVAKKGSLDSGAGGFGHRPAGISRENAIEYLTDVSGDDAVVTTTGKISRELFEIRVRKGQDHARDFLTVGSMGHSSMIALGISLKTKGRVWCIDGDGSVLMHMGALSAIGEASPRNLIHVVMNNSAHESVGGMPTASPSADFSEIASSCGYKYTKRVADRGALMRTLETIKEKDGPILIEIVTELGSRPNLGRPTATVSENRDAFMKHLRAIR